MEKRKIDSVYSENCKDDPVGPKIIGRKAHYQGDDCVNIADRYSSAMFAPGGFSSMIGDKGTAKKAKET